MRWLTLDRYFARARGGPDSLWAPKGPLRGHLRATRHRTAKARHIVPRCYRSLNDGCHVAMGAQMTGATWHLTSRVRKRELRARAALTTRSHAAVVRSCSMACARVCVLFVCVCVVCVWCVVCAPSTACRMLPVDARFFRWMQERNGPVDLEVFCALA